MDAQIGRMAEANIIQRKSPRLKAMLQTAFHMPSVYICCNPLSRNCRHIVE
jgi:hypothetical protein